MKLPVVRATRRRSLGGILPVEQLIEEKGKRATSFDDISGMDFRLPLAPRLVEDSAQSATNSNGGRHHPLFFLKCLEHDD